jgi:putative ATP-binding cassette transporter
MPILAALVAVVSVIALGLGLAKLATGTIVMGVAGLLLAASTFRAPGISAFLRLFIVIFAVEYTIVGAAVLAAENGFWPEAYAALKPPNSMAITFGLFGALIYAVSFIPVVRQITRLADPYFDLLNTDRVTLPFLGTVREPMLGIGLVTALVLINQFQVGINVRLSFFNRDWFNAIQNKDAEAFWSLLVTVFLFWAMISVVSNLIEFFLQSVLQIRWRDWLTKAYGASWLDEGTHYRMAFQADETDNPDQRIAEDVRNYINNTYAYSISLLSTISNLVSFSIILWSIPAEFAVPGTDVVIPGLLFWVALLYSVLGTWLTHLIGRPLIRLEFQQERYEADFRYSLARLREYGEQVALLKGEEAEKQNLARRFANVVGNYYALVYRNLKLNIFVSSYFQASVVFPYLLVAPAYFANKITLGVMTQTAGAFGRVESAMQWFIARYQSLASYKAIVDRLTTFEVALDKLRGERKADRLALPSIPGTDVAVSDLSLAIPAGQTIVRVPSLTLKAGQSTLLTGPSGSGKSTFFRALAGIWPFGRGTIGVPDGKSVMLLPQRPYIPQGTLRTAVTYPGLHGEFSDAAIKAALVAARLPKLIDRLDEEALWSQVLSLGEQQRLAIARALLEKPDWLFLDEATAALDEATEERVYRMLAEELPGTTIVSIGHRSTLIGLHERRIDLRIAEDGVFEPAEARVPAE